MGTMGCFRNGCRAVLCTLYSKKHGYICADCFDELVELA